MTSLEPAGGAPVGPRHRRKEPTWTKVAGVAGKALIIAGVVVLLFVVFQIFGTSYLQSRHQSSLRSQLDTKGILSTVPTTTPNSPPVTVAPGAAPGNGGPVAVIAIPKISLNQVVVQGTAEGDLELGPGHYTQTPLPGENGNVAIAGHRTTWGKPFYNLDQLKPGDLIYLATSRGTFVYKMTSSQIVDPTDVGVLDPTPTPTLTLTTCNPKYSAAQRLVVKAVLASTLPSIALDPVSLGPSTTVHNNSSQSGPKGSSLWSVFLFALLTIVLCVGAWFLAPRLQRRWVAYAVVAPFALASLFVFFAQVSSHLPAGI